VNHLAVHQQVPQVLALVLQIHVYQQLLKIFVLDLVLHQVQAVHHLLSIVQVQVLVLVFLQ